MHYTVTLVMGEPEISNWLPGDTLIITNSFHPVVIQAVPKVQ